MRLLAASLSFSLFAACSQGTPIKDLPDKKVSKSARDWKDPGATPDQPLDAGAPAVVDAGDEPEPVIEADAGAIDAGP